MKRTVIAALALVAMVSCMKDDTDSAITQGDVAKFSTSTTMTRIHTSSSSTSWNSDDMIGISSDNGDDNVAYKAKCNFGGGGDGDGDGGVMAHHTKVHSAPIVNFEFAGSEPAEEIRLHRTEEKTYSAYYPYQEGIEYLTSDVSDQSDWGKLDILVAKGAKGKEGMSGNIGFNFEHALSIIQIDITAGESVDPAAMGDIKVKLCDVPVVANINHLTGELYDDDTTIGNVQFLTNSYFDWIDKKNKAVARAIINPVEFAGAKLVITVGNGNDEHTVNLNLVPERGMRYEYSAELKYETVELKQTSISPWKSETVGALDNLQQYDITYNDGCYEIYTGKGLKAFADIVRYGGVEDDVVYFGGEENFVFEGCQTSVNGKLMSDVDLSEICGLIGGKKVDWTPIGQESEPQYERYDTEYMGVFDGNGYSVNGLYISSGDEYSGLFGVVKSSPNPEQPAAEIKNLTVRGSVTGERYVGGIVAYMEGEKTKITSCENYAEVESYTWNDVPDNGYSEIGGVVGRAGSSIIALCKNYGNITRTSLYNDEFKDYTTRAGGIVGYTSGAINNCENEGNIGIGTIDPSTHEVVSYPGIYAGGIVGMIDGAEMWNCENRGEISTASLSGKFSVGGVAGFVTNDAKASTCQNYGDVHAKAKTNQCYVGGVFGTVSSRSKATNCKREGEVITISGEGDETSVGGVCGCLEIGSTLSGCFNMSPVYSHGEYVGGVVGFCKTSTVEMCYNGATSNVSISDNSASDNRYIGGVIGYIDGDDSTVDGCYNLGTLELPTETRFVYAGGVIGANEAYSKGHTIKDCYNAGKLNLKSAIKNDIYRLYIGGVIGRFDNNQWEEQEASTITGCYNSEPITYVATEGNYEETEYRSLGGVIGYCEKNNIIENCWNTAKIDSELCNTGGVVGYTKGNISGCYNKGDVLGKNLYTGGIAGFAEANVTKCYNTAKVQCDDVNNFCTFYIGGICGVLSGGNLSLCYNTGEFAASNSGGEYVGGLVGSLESNGTNLTVSDCYSSAEVVTNGEGCFLGGLFGRVSNVTRISNCYCAGEVGTNEAVASIGGLIAYKATAATIEATNCYYDTTVIKAYDLANKPTTAISSDDGGILDTETVKGLPTADMQGVNSPMMTEFGTTLWVGTEGAYPTLKWQAE